MLLSPPILIRLEVNRSTWKSVVHARQLMAVATVRIEVGREVVVEVPTVAQEARDAVASRRTAVVAASHPAGEEVAWPHEVVGSLKLPKFRKQPAFHETANRSLVQGLSVHVRHHRSMISRPFPDTASAWVEASAYSCNLFALFLLSQRPLSLRSSEKFTGSGPRFRARSTISFLAFLSA